MTPDIKAWSPLTSKRTGASSFLYPSISSSLLIEPSLSISKGAMSCAYVSSSSSKTRSSIVPSLSPSKSLNISSTSTSVNTSSESGFALIISSSVTSLFASASVILNNGIKSSGTSESCMAPSPFSSNSSMK